MEPEPFLETQKIFSNEIYTYADGKVLHRPVFQGKNKDWDLSEMQVPSFADEWDISKNNEPVIVSQCYAARAAVGMAGHGKLFSQVSKKSTTNPPDNDFVYWQDVKNLSWSTYNDAFLVPKSVQKYNLYQFYLNHKKDISTHFEAKDPIDLIAKIHHFQGSEFQAKMDGALFRDTITETIINTKKDNDGITDLAYVTLKATDAVGHLYGWESKEAEQVLKATDQEIQTIFEFLKSNFGDRFIMVVTADHGAAPMPEISNGLFLSHEQFFSNVNELLPESERTKRSLVKWVAHSQLSLDKDLMQTYQISEEAIIQKIMSIQINDRKFFRKVWKREEIPNLSL